jgi:hypothetical protein
MRPTLGMRGAAGMPPAFGRLRHRYRRRCSLDGRLDKGRRLRGDDGKRSSRRGMRYSAGCDRARRRHVSIQRHETGHHQGANHDKVFQDKHHFPLGPQGPPHSISRGSGRVGSFPFRPGAWMRGLQGDGGGGNGFEPPSRAVHARALPIELPCRPSTVTSPARAGLVKIAHARARPARRQMRRPEAAGTGP